MPVGKGRKALVHARGRKAKPAVKYHWKSDEEVSDGLQRIVSQTLHLAIWNLSGNAASLDDAVHEARKSLKKARSAMRLLRGKLGPEFDVSYDGENAALRDAGRKLSPLRDTHALIEMFDEMHREYRKDLGDRAWLGLRDALIARKQRIERDFERQRTRGKIAGTLRQSAARVDQWHLEPGTFRDLSDGFARTIRGNRKACRDAVDQASPEKFHEWRKRAKDLRYHLGLLGKAWPPVFEGYEQAAKDLERRLGEDHNLVVLRNTILEQPDAFGSPKHIEAFLDIVERRQKKLRKGSKDLAQRLYADGPRHWRRRLERCWKTPL